VSASAWIGNDAVRVGWIANPSLLLKTRREPDVETFCWRVQLMFCYCFCRRACQLIFSPDEEVLTDACWALSYLSDGPNEKIQAVIEAGVCKRVIELLMHPSPTIQTPALRTVGNIVTGDDLQVRGHGLLYAAPSHMVYIVTGVTFV
jgi:hypothetical protein